VSRFLLAGAIVALVSISPAGAQELSAEIGIVSDYRYRGLSLSGGDPAAQASLTLEHDSGWYAQASFSTLGSRHPKAAEIDLTAGFEKDLSEHLGFDISAAVALYPDAPADAYFEATAAATISRGKASARFGLSFIPAQRATGGAGNGYAFGEAELALSGAPITLKAAIGYERGAFDEAEHGGKRDWSFGTEIARGPAKFFAAYVGSNADGEGRHALIASLLGEF
jgi:uncharacterized protein (TIGR02001 family)